MPAWAESPAAYVHGILTKVMSLQNDGSLSGQARASDIHAIIGRSFDFGMMATGGVIAAIPPILIALVFQRYLISGLSSGAVKG